MKITHKILIGIVLLLSNSIFSQQESLFTMYSSHMNIINPAYVGVDDETFLTSSIRSQWSGIKDSPETQALSFGTPLGKNLGIGTSMVFDKTFIERQNFLAIDFSYKVIMKEGLALYFGIKAGGNFYNINTSGLQTYAVQSDPNLVNIDVFNPNVGVGALIKHEKYYLSLSVPRILNTERAKNNNGFASVATDRPHLYLSGGYNFKLNTITPLVIKPTFILRYVNGAPVSADINALLQINKNFEFGGMYRTGDTFGGIIKLRLSKRLWVGFSRELNSRAELANVKGTNEFYIQFRF